MKTISQALIDEVLYPIPEGYVENVIIKRGLTAETGFTKDVAEGADYKGALADCLYSLIHSVNFSESDKSIGSLSDTQRSLILKRVNSLYSEIGESLVETEEPQVFIGG